MRSEVDRKYICDVLDFTGILSVGANMQYEAPDAGAVTSAANRRDLKTQIAAYEPEYVRLMFGEAMRNALYTYLRRADTSIVEERWETLLSLLRGDEYGVSPVACYVYFRILETRHSQITETGVVSSAAEYATSALPRQVQAWGMMVEGNCAVWEHAAGAFTDLSPRAVPHMFERVNSLGI